MLRNGSSRPLHWTDKTMSVMRADLTFAVPGSDAASATG